jgi:hypothetical protein
VSFLLPSPSEPMSIDQIQDQVSAVAVRNDKKGRGARQSQNAEQSDYGRYENLLRRMDEVYTELVNLRREHNQFVSSLMKRLMPFVETRERN